MATHGLADILAVCLSCFVCHLYVFSLSEVFGTGYGQR